MFFDPAKLLKSDSAPPARIARIARNDKETAPFSQNSQFSQPLTPAGTGLNSQDSQFSQAPAAAKPTGTDLEQTGRTMLAALATELRHPLADLLDWYKADLEDLGAMAIGQAREVVADYLRYLPGYHPATTPDQAEAIREAAEEREAIQIEDGGLTEQQAQDQRQRFEAYLQHIMATAKATGCCHAPTGRYCPEGTALWLAYADHAKSTIH